MHDQGKHAGIVTIFAEAANGRRVKGVTRTAARLA